MISSNEIQKTKDIIEEFLGKMTMTDFTVEVKAVPSLDVLELWPQRELKEDVGQKETIELDIALQEPQFLIGQNGQTLAELEKVVRILLNKKLSALHQESEAVAPLGQKSFYFKLDINNYRKKKVEYLKKMAEDLANEVATTKEKKVLPPMSAYERRVIHTELAKRQDIATESQGEGFERRVVISPKV